MGNNVTQTEIILMGH